MAYYHRNRQYNTSALTDSSGSVLEMYSTDAMGRVKAFDAAAAAKAAPTATTVLFTGRVWDVETGLYYFRARYFEPELGVFVSRDPLGFVDGYSVFHGWFAERFSLDPSGKKFIIPCGGMSQMRMYQLQQTFNGGNCRSSYQELRTIILNHPVCGSQRKSLEAIDRADRELDNGNCLTAWSFLWAEAIECTRYEDCYEKIKESAPPCPCSNMQAKVFPPYNIPFIPCAATCSRDSCLGCCTTISIAYTAWVEASTFTQMDFCLLLIVDPPAYFLCVAGVQAFHAFQVRNVYKGTESCRAMCNRAKFK